MLNLAVGGKLERTRSGLKISTTPVSDFKGLASLLPLDELLRLWEPQKLTLRTIWGL